MLQLALYMCFEQVKAKKKKKKIKRNVHVCFILFLKHKIRAIFCLEYMCSVFTFVQYIRNPRPVCLQTNEISLYLEAFQSNKNSDSLNRIGKTIRFSQSEVFLHQNL